MVEGTHQIGIHLCSFVRQGKPRSAAEWSIFVRHEAGGGLANGRVDKGPRVASRINNGHFTKEQPFSLSRLSSTPTRPFSHLGPALSLTFDLWQLTGAGLTCTYDKHVFRSPLQCKNLLYKNTQWPQTPSSLYLWPLSFTFSKAWRKMRAVHVRKHFQFVSG